MKVKKSPSHRRGDAKSTSCTCCYGAGVESPLTLLSICSACAGRRDPTYAATNSRCVRLAYRVYLARVSNSRLRSYPAHTPCKTQLAQLFCVKSIGLADFCLPCKSKRAPLLSVQQLRCNETACASYSSDVCLLTASCTRSLNCSIRSVICCSHRCTACVLPRASALRFILRKFVSLFSVALAYPTMRP